MVALGLPSVVYAFRSEEMIILYIICILLMFISVAAGSVCGIQILSALIAVWVKKDERERRDRCTKSVTFNIVGWESRRKLVDAKKNRHETRYTPKYEYEFEGTTYQAIGEVDRFSTSVSFNTIQINPDNPYEIYEPDSYDIENSLKLALVLFVIACITYTIADWIGVDQALEYMSKFM